MEYKNLTQSTHYKYPRLQRLDTKFPEIFWISKICNDSDFDELFNRYFQGPRNGFHLGVAYSNADFEKVDFQKIL